MGGTRNRQDPQRPGKPRSVSSSDDSNDWDMEFSDSDLEDDVAALKCHRSESNVEALLVSGEIVPLSRQHSNQLSLNLQLRPAAQQSPTAVVESEAGYRVVMPHVPRLSSAPNGFETSGPAPTVELEAMARDKLNFALKQSATYASFLRERVDELIESSDSSGSGEAIRARELSDAFPAELTLMPHQLFGSRWLLSLYENGVSGVLADEMGLGKTIQVVTFLGQLISERELGPHLIVAPLSTITDGWKRELSKWLPEVPVVVLHGTDDARVAAKREITSRCKPLRADASRYSWRDLLRSRGGIILTTYEIATREQTFLAGLPKLGVMVVDEAHRLKNFRCKLVEALKRIPCDGRFVLTGTPVQNSLAELWSVLNFVAPDVFQELSHFRLWFDASQVNAGAADASVLATAPAVRGVAIGPSAHLPKHTKEQAAAIVRMHRVLRPFMLRRTKIDAGLHLPPLVQLILRCPLTPLQRVLYRKLAAKQPTSTTGDVGLMDGDAGRARPRNGIHGVRAGAHTSKLRLLCCHPFLVDDVDPYREAIVANGFSTRWPENPKLEAAYLEDLVETSGKMQVLSRLLPELVKNGHRVLIFSQFTLVLDILEEYLHMPRAGSEVPVLEAEQPPPLFEYVRLDGSRSSADRVNALQRFNTDESVKLFLLSTRAGGVGLNICAADTVILFDGDYNPHNDVQAISRCHRIGQTKPVVAFRLISPGTVEETVLQFGISKLRMEHVLVGCGSFGGNDVATAADDSAAVSALLREEERARIAVAAALATESASLISDATVTVSEDLSWSSGPGISSADIAALSDRQAVVSRFATVRGAEASGDAQASDDALFVSAPFEAIVGI